MKVLLDAMMPTDIADHLFGHEVQHAAKLGWQNLKNGALLTQAEASGFDVLLTKDVSLRYQQNFSGRSIALLVVRPRSQEFEELVALAPKVLDALSRLTPGTISVVPAR